MLVFLLVVAVDGSCDLEEFFWMFLHREDLELSDTEMIESHLLQTHKEGKCILNGVSGCFCANEADLAFIFVTCHDAKK